MELLFMDHTKKERLLWIELRKREMKADRRETRPGGISLISLQKEVKALLRSRESVHGFALENE